MTEATLKALANSDEPVEIMPTDGGNCEEVLSQFAKRGINVDVWLHASGRRNEIILKS
jgi:hypothetical protein